MAWTPTERRADRERRALEAMLANPDDPRHGTTGGYGYGCRCTECGTAGRGAAAADRGSGRAAQRAAQHLAAMAADPADRRHGTRVGYGYGCRCSLCRTASSQGVMAIRARTKTKPEQHGTTTGYQRGCRCRACREAQNSYDRSRRKRDDE